MTFLNKDLFRSLQAHYTHKRIKPAAAIPIGMWEVEHLAGGDQHIIDAQGINKLVGNSIN
jgi:hypothetical protein